MDALTLLNVALAVVNLAVGLFQGWKEWQARQAPRTKEPLQLVQIHPHPLEAALRDVAAAIRGQTRPLVDARGKIPP